MKNLQTFRLKIPMESCFLLAEKNELISFCWIFVFPQISRRILRKDEEEDEEDDEDDEEEDEEDEFEATKEVR